MSGPCNWTIDTTCCQGWDEFTPETQKAATDYAELILWAATGRRFGLCELTVRPCGRAHGTVLPLWGVGTFLSQGFWLPFTFPHGGLLRNCGCRNFCNCKPCCEAYLPGPVDSVIEVIVDGVVVDPGTYEVQDRHWLVRTNDECWPECPDMASNEAFEVTYIVGEPVPAALAVATGVLACEFARACAGQDCRLPGRLQFIARQGVTAQMVDLDRLMDRGLTGLAEVDQVIAALNPHAIKARPRVWSPDRPMPRTVTTPTGS